MTTNLAGVLTDVGAQLIEEAYQAGKTVVITQMAIGDGGGNPVEVKPSVTNLVREFHRQMLDNGVAEDAILGGSINYIPQADHRGKWLREFGLLDASGNLIVYAAYSPSQIPENPNMAVQFIIGMMVPVMNIEAIEVQVNPEGTVTQEEFHNHTHKLTLSGDATGSVTLGKDDATLEVTVKDDSHAHQGTLTNPIPLAKEDLNTLTTPKVYRQDSDANAALVLNYPEAKSGSLIVTVGAGVQQRYHVYNSSRVYTRAQYNTGAFTPWAREYNTQNKPSAEDVGALAKIGDTATGNIIAPKFIMNTSQGTGPGDAVRYDFLPGSIPKLSPLISGHLNNFTEKGFYQQNATSPDPGGTLGYPVNYSGGLLVFSNGGGMCQIYLTNPNANGGQRRIYYRNYWIGSWGPWTAIYDTNFKPTAADVGAASASHTHTPASIGAANTMLPFINGGSRDGFTQCTVSLVRWGRAYPLTFAIPSTTTAFWIANRGGENADRDYDFGVNCVRSGSNMTLTPVGSDATISTIHIM